MGKEEKEGKGGTVLVVDDDETNLDTTEFILKRKGYRVLKALSGEIAMGIVRNNEVDILLTDLKLPGIDGIELMKAAGTFLPDMETIIMTAYGTVDNAVDAMKEGAYDFITKPVKKVYIERAVEKGMEKRALLKENRALRSELLSRKKRGGIIGNSGVIRRLMELAAQVARSSANIFIEGESGTGKEILAEAIHDMSDREGNPLVKINCAAIPEGLLESELFGYEPGAFTGALVRKKGKFELADRGTIFLDEVMELPLPLQSKILRVLQGGEFERVGGTKTLKVDVRVIAATNQNPEKGVETGRFRKDLYFRLNVIRLKVPPLRERKEDIPLLAGHFIRLFNEKNRRDIRGIEEGALKVLLSWEWPGNVRELQNVIERAVVLAAGEKIRACDLPAELIPEKGYTPASIVADGGGLLFPVGTPLEEIEKGAILKTLAYSGGDKEKAAKLLGISSRTIYRRLREIEEGAKEPAS